MCLPSIYLSMAVPHTDLASGSCWRWRHLQPPDICCAMASGCLQDTSNERQRLQANLALAPHSLTGVGFTQHLHFAHLGLPFSHALLTSLWDFVYYAASEKATRASIKQTSNVYTGRGEKRRWAGLRGPTHHQDGIASTSMPFSSGGHISLLTFFV